MRAFAYEAYGGADACAVRNVPLPQPTGRQCRIKVRAASLNPIDFKRRGGAMKMLMPDTFPVIIGYDAAGVVDAVGPDVPAELAKVGDRVVCRTTVSTSGTVAEYCLSDVDTLALIPEGIKDTDAAAVPLAGMTALQMLRAAGLKTGDDVIINAAAGGVGHFAVQLAKVLGAGKVVATASAGKHALLRGLGADECVDYRTGPYAERFQKEGRKFDVGIDNVSESKQLISITKAGGSVISNVEGFTAELFEAIGVEVGCIVRLFLWFSSRGVIGEAKSANVKFSGLFLKPSREDLTQLMSFMSAGLLRAHVNIFKGLEAAPKAMEMMESGRTTGKVVIEISS